VTAWSGVTGGRPVLPGEHVLVVGGGSVAMFAIQFASLFGAHVIAVTSRPEKADLLHALGAEDVLVASELPDWNDRVVALSDGRGVEHVVEAVGPATLARSIRSCALDAEIALAGIFAGTEGFDPSALAGRLVTIRRLAVGSRAAFEAMNAAIARHELKPVIDRVFPFAEAPLAYRHFAAMQHTGKVVIGGAE
jgi:NADPH:quinone reductase-like Zn-dependent oxidoreductase